MKKVFLGIAAVLVIVGATMYVQSNSAQTAMSDSSFENDAAVILSTAASDAAKVAQLNANLQARMAAKKLRAAKSGINLGTIPPTTIKK